MTLAVAHASRFFHANLFLTQPLQVSSHLFHQIFHRYVICIEDGEECDQILNTFPTSNSTIRFLLDASVMNALIFSDNNFAEKEPWVAVAIATFQLLN